MKKLLITIVLFICMFQGLTISNWFGYWDEIGTIGLFFLWIFLSIKNGKFSIKRKNSKMFICILIPTIIAIIANIMYGYAYSLNAILRDIVGFGKFPISFLLFRELQYDKYSIKCVKKYLLPVFKAISWIIGIFGIISLFFDVGMSQNEIRHGIQPYQFLFSHPTFLVQQCVLLILFLNALLDKDESKKYDILLGISIILAMRTKGFVFIAVYFVTKYWDKIINYFKQIYWILAGIVVVIVGLPKLKLLMSFSTSERETLYRGSIQLALKCFPLGSGFATYASNVSGKYLSKVYSFIQLSGVFINGVANATIGDAGFAYYIGQFGFIGTISFLLFLYLLTKSVNTKKINVTVMSFIAFVVISLTSENLLLNNGFELGVLFSILCAIENENNNKLEENI